MSHNATLNVNSYVMIEDWKDTLDQIVGSHLYYTEEFNTGRGGGQLGHTGII